MKRSLGSRSVATAAVVLMTAVWLMRIPAQGKDVCGDCIRERMEEDCPACAPPLRCMAQCLWGGAPRSTCILRCDYGGGAWPRLSTCRQCLSRCNCTCTPSSSPYNFNSYP